MVAFTSQVFTIGDIEYTITDVNVAAQLAIELLKLKHMVKNN